MWIRGVISIVKKKLNKWCDRHGIGWFGSGTVIQAAAEWKGKGDKKGTGEAEKKGVTVTVVVVDLV